MNVNQALSGLRSSAEGLVKRLPRRPGAARHQGAGAAAEPRELLIVRNGQLLHPASGGSTPIEGGDALYPPPGAIASAAADLLGERDEPPALVLLLPSHEFVVTTVTLPGVARESLPSALELQAPTLLPGFDEPMALAVSARGNPDDLSDVVLWIRHGRMDALYEAFRERGLSLAGVMPRILGAAGGDGPVWLEDADSHGITRVHWEDGVVRQWLQTSRVDLEEPAFHEQWQQQVEESRQQAVPEQRLENAADWLALAGTLDRGSDYCFLPAGARAEAERRRRRRRVAVAAAGVVAVIGLGAAPFGLQTLQAWQLNATLDGLREQAADARRDQQAVADFEQRWGVFTEFPRQDVTATLMALQEVIRPDVLSSLELEEGMLTIEGRSSDPQSLLQALDGHERFTGVNFARATNDDRYAIEMQLTTVDFPAYFDWYFPEQR